MNAVDPKHPLAGLVSLCEKYEHEMFSGARVTWYDHGPHIELIALSVPNKLQGQGIGSQIVRYLKKKGKPILVIPVAMDMGRDQDLIRFYCHRHGFVEQYPGSDWLMWKP